MLFLGVALGLSLGTKNSILDPSVIRDMNGMECTGNTVS